MIFLILWYTFVIFLFCMCLVWFFFDFIRILLYQLVKILFFMIMFVNVCGLYLFLCILCCFTDWIVCSFVIFVVSLSWHILVWFTLVFFWFWFFFVFVMIDVALTNRWKLKNFEITGENIMMKNNRILIQNWFTIFRISISDTDKSDSEWFKRAKKQQELIFRLKKCEVTFFVPYLK